MTEESTENFRDDEANRGDHGPGENARLKRRMNVAAMRMSMGTVRMAVIVVGVGVVAHEVSFYRTRLARERKVIVMTLGAKAPVWIDFMSKLKLRPPKE